MTVLDVGTKPMLFGERPVERVVLVEGGEHDIELTGARRKPASPTASRSLLRIALAPAPTVVVRRCRASQPG